MDFSARLNGGCPLKAKGHALTQSHKRWFFVHNRSGTKYEIVANRLLGDTQISETASVDEHK